jgi:hypothetical protein
LVLASDYRVDDFDAWWSRISSETAAIAHLGAHHVVVYRSLDDPRRIFVTVGVHAEQPPEALLRSPGVFEWFDSAGVDDLPPVFAGRVVEKIELHDQMDGGDEPPGVVVASIARLDNVAGLMDAVRVSLAEMRAAGVRRWWLYRALDDADEVMVLREIDTVQQAERWLTHPVVGANLLQDAGIGVYPPPFVGVLVQSIELSAPMKHG